MGIVKTFSVPEQSARYAPNVAIAEGQNRISLLLGENGTRKSRLLRGLLNDALTSSSNPLRSSRVISANTTFEQRPNRVIAVSATPNDRFPARRRGALGRVDTHLAGERYDYIGPRTSSNLVSRKQSLESLLSAFLLTPPVGPTQKEFVKYMSAKARVPYALHFSLMAKLHVRDEQELERLLDRYFLTGIYSTKSQRDELEEGHAFAHEMRPEIKRILQLVGRGRNDKSRFELDLTRGWKYDLNPIAIHFALRMGILSVWAPEFAENGRSGIALDDFSAGEWGLFSSMVTLAASVTDHSLVLIDEPENALHPAWQREYVADLRRALSAVNGCDVFIATHSPLIANAIDARTDSLFKLTRMGAKIGVEELEIPDGWDAKAVLEDIFSLTATRNPDISEGLQRALTLVGDGVAANKQELRALSMGLHRYLDLLPDDDMARPIILALAKLSR